VSAIELQSLLPVAFVISNPLLDELRAWRAGREIRDTVEEELDAYCMDPGLGPGWYLTADGRVLRDGRGWDDAPLREATEAEAFRAIVVGAKKTGISSLLALLPPQPDGASPCKRCDGTRSAALGPHGNGPRLVCPSCCGLGWVVR
jgi:hypothetical protein